MNKIENAIMLADILHSNQTYGDGEKYIVHLKDVHDILKSHGEMNEEILCSAILHDILEDTIMSLGKLKEYFGDNIANIVYLVTDEYGFNRKERKLKTYSKLSGNKNAIKVKLADRISNTRKGLSNKNDKFVKMYNDEYGIFKYHLYQEFDDIITSKLWTTLDDLYEESNNYLNNR